MKKALKKSLRLRTLLFLTALFLMLSMGVHVIDLHHEHPEEIFGEGISAILHMEHKKWWLLLLMSFLLVVWCDATRSLRAEIAAEKSALLNAFSFSFNFSHFFDPIRIALRRGILHPKIYDECGIALA